MATQLQQLQSAIATLKTNSQSITSVSLDAKRRMLLFGYLKKQGSTVTDVSGWLSNSIPSAFQGWNPELQLNASIYLLALNNGLPTNGPAFQALVDQAVGWSTSFPSSSIAGTGWGVADGIVDDDTVRQLRWYAQLLDFGALFPTQSQI